jgi:hypothetical protein
MRLVDADGLDEDDDDDLPMDFDDLVALLRGFAGEAVDVGVKIPSGGEDPFHIASFSGVVANVSERHDVWRLCCERDERSPSPNALTIDRRLYLAATFDGETLRISLVNARVEILLYR